MAQHHVEPRGERGERRSDELRTFLTELARAVTTGDGEAAARLWEVPAFVIGSGMARSLANPEEIAQFFGGARAQYNANGITATRPQIVSEDWIDDDLVTVSVRWPYLESNGREIGAETSDYTISRAADGSLRLRVAVMRGVEGATGKPS